MGSQSEMLVNATKTLSDAQLELFKDYPDILINFATAFCVIFTLVGIPGNIITIVALARDKKVLNATAIFIMSLSFSDLLSCCLLIPLTASVYYHRPWVHVQCLCQITPFIRYTLVGNTLFTVLAITFNRFIMIVHSKFYIKIYTKRNIILMLLFSWIIPFGKMIPTVLEKFGRFGLNISSGSYTILKYQTNTSPKQVIILTSFIVPFLTIIICYSRIFCIVQKATIKSLNTKKRFPKPKASSSFDPSTSFPVCVTAENNCNYGAGTIKTTKDTLRDTNIKSTNLSTNMKISEYIISQPEELKNESRTFRTKSLKFLKKGLPTRKDRRLGNIIIALFTSYCLCNLPITIINLLQEKNNYPILNITAHMLFYLSSCLNPIIYVVMSNEYRKSYTNLFKRSKNIPKQENSAK